MIGVLLMAYGTPRGLDEVEDFYTQIRGGRAPSPAILANLRARYEAIGGRGPLLDITQAQAAGLQRQLGPEFGVYVGMRHWHPYIHDVVREMADAGIREAVAMAMTPQFSSLSVGAYLQAADEASGPITFHPIRSWYQQPAYVNAMAGLIESASAGWQPDMVVFTAHSLPRRTIEEGDPYVFQLQQTAWALAEKLEIGRWMLSFQSAGQGDGARVETWLGPDILETLDRLASDGAERVLAVPIGFIADHLEILYDLDILAERHARSLGVELRRTQSLNAHPGLSEALAAAVREVAPS